MNRPIPQHAASRQARRFRLVAVLLTIVGALALFLGAGAFGVLYMCLGVLAGTWSIFAGAQFVAVQTINSSAQSLLRNDLEEAEALLAQVPKRGRWGSVPFAIEIQRTIIALRRNRWAEMETHTSHVVNGDLGFWLRSFKRHQKAIALSHRAFARVALGRLEEAVADAERAEGTREAMPEAIARARLVRGVVPARHEQWDDLGVFLRENATLLSENASPVDRVTARALRKLAAAKTKKSVYREPSPPSKEGETNPLLGLVSAVVPDAAAYVEKTATMPETAPPPSMPNAAPRAMPKGKSTAVRRVVLLWVVLIVMFGAMWTFFSPSDAPKQHGSRRAPVAQVEETKDTSSLPLAAITIFGAVVIALAYVYRARAASDAIRMTDARRFFALGRKQEGRAIFEQLAQHRFATISGVAKMELARLESADASFDRAIAYCNDAIPRVNTPILRPQVSDLLLPMLVGELAIAEAGSLRARDAEGHLATVETEFPAFPLLPSISFRVRLLLAVRANNLEKAAAIAHTRNPELPVPRRDEALADLVIAASGPMSNEQREALSTELASEPDVRKWIDAVAPGLVDKALAT